MPRFRLGTILMLLTVGSGAACAHVQVESAPFFAQPTKVIALSPSCVPTAPMPIIGLKLGAPKPLAPAREYNMPVVRLPACYLEDRGTISKKIVPARDTIPPQRNKK